MSDKVTVLLRQHGRTYCEDAGITLTDKPSPLWRLLVLSLVLSARINSEIAVAAARELSHAGYRTPRAMSTPRGRTVSTPSVEGTIGATTRALPRCSGNWPRRC